MFLMFPQNSDISWKPTMAVAADVGTFIKDLSCALNNFEVDGDWIAKLAGRDKAKEDANSQVKICLWHLFGSHY